MVPDNPTPIVEFGEYRPDVSTPDLGGEILRLRGQIESFIDAKVAQLKAGRDGASMPVEQLRHMLTRGDSCLCRAATNILAENGQ